MDFWGFIFQNIFNPFNIVHWIVLISILLYINYRFNIFTTNTIIVGVIIMTLISFGNYYYNPSIDSRHLIEKGYCGDGICIN